MTNTRKDNRSQYPQSAHRAAFMKGWADAAVKQNRYATIDSHKTHANMGNLFGWIFGDKSEDFKKEIWELYLENALNIEEQ